jgi:protein-S-isoprenylcysteine O-methyltransferase
MFSGDLPGNRTLQVKHMTIINILTITTQILWAFCEFIIYIQKRSKEENADKNSYKILYIISVGSLFFGIFYGNYCLYSRKGCLFYNPSILFPILGACIIILGIIIRLTAIATLKKYFTINVVIQDDHKLITTGLYKTIRHPAYAGGILSFIGCGLSYGNILSFVIIVFPYLLFILQRIKVEEVLLTDKFGEQYIDLKKHTKKIIPYIF